MKTKNRRQSATVFGIIKPILTKIGGDNFLVTLSLYKCTILQTIASSYSLFSILYCSMHIDI